MQFGSRPVEGAAGAILAHAVRADGRVFRKGRVLTADDVAVLATAGIGEVVVARLEADDVGEDEAALRIARPMAGEGIAVSAPFAGRANLYAGVSGLVVLDTARVAALNDIDEAITLATLPPFARVGPRQMLATIKIIPFAAPGAAVRAAQHVLDDGPILRVAAFKPHGVALISTALPATKPALLDKNRATLEQRLAPLGSRIVFETRVAHETKALASAIGEAVAAGADPILIFGASAITDRRDVIPAAIEAAGGAIGQFGMPVDPGNLLLTAILNGATIIGLPGCARSPKLNGFDFVLWRVLAGLPIGRAEIAAMGVGGLLNEIPTRPQPREEREPPRRPKIGAIVLAAGMSSRMGANKLLASVDGKPLLRHAVEAALASHADPVIVVTGNQAAETRASLAGLNISFTENPDFAKGLSASLRTGLNALPDDCDGALILLGDMPKVPPSLIDRLIAGFDPAEGRAICVATSGGKRGNPVLWARRFFPEMTALEGDVGAKHLMAAYGELVCEVEAADDGPLLDIDTPEALDAYRRKT
jgi:molybdenum cofactor cytidylyltransferase